jgi:hypothetical protein
MVRTSPMLRRETGEYLHGSEQAHPFALCVA